MQEANFRRWLDERQISKSTAGTLLSDAKRVERDYAIDLDTEYAKDGLQSIIGTLRYTAKDRDRNAPNPSKINVPNVYKSLPAYRSAVDHYRLFRSLLPDTQPTPERFTTTPNVTPPPDESDIGQRLSLERDMQAMLRTRIATLEPGLEIADGGIEKSVDSGMIDITAKDSQGKTVVIELKAGTANRQAVAQILSYMGSISEETGTPPEDVRGILVASDFDKRARASALMVPNVMLRRYEVYFKFFGIESK